MFMLCIYRIFIQIREYLCVYPYEKTVGQKNDNTANHPASYALFFSANRLIVNIIIVARFTKCNRFMIILD
jgi:hypothetical protein